MTFIPSKAIITCTALSIMALASTANASSEVNKFPASQTAFKTDGFQATSFSAKAQKNVGLVTKRRRTIRIEKPLPPSTSRGLSYVSDKGTSNLRGGFNKMPAHSNQFFKPMPIFTGEGATNAR